MGSICMMVHLKSPDGFCYQAGIFKNIAKTKHTGDTSFEDKLFLASDEFVLFLECEFVFILFTIQNFEKVVQNT